MVAVVAVTVTSRTKASAEEAKGTLSFLYYRGNNHIAFIFLVPNNPTDEYIQNPWR